MPHQDSKTYGPDLDSDAAISSPCRNICKINRNSRWCTGCGRTASEIARWTSISQSERMAILQKLPKRMELCK
ncbi:MAG: DUF1289 domain-containing protein [Pseudomonadota bacterium]